MDSLKFGSVAELAEAYKLADFYIIYLNQNSCADVYDSFDTLIRNANLAVHDPEKQLGSFLRCRDMAKIIMEKPEFSIFYKRLEFCNTLADILQRAKTLRADLAVQYDNKLKSIKSDTSPSHLISPRDLVTMVERDSDIKTAVIFDFRPDKSQYSIQYPKADLITVIPVDRHLLKEWSFRKLKVRMEFDPRLQMLISHCLPTVDMVVLMDDVTPSLTTYPPAECPALMLLDALFEYDKMVNCRWKTLLMEGGFEGWKSVFPMYVHNNMNTTTELDDSLKECIIRECPQLNLDIEYPAEKPNPHVVAQDLPPNSQSSIHRYVDASMSSWGITNFPDQVTIFKWSSYTHPQCIGCGNYGHVFKVYDEFIGDMAVKKFVRGASTKKELDEIKHIMNARHPHIIQFYGYLVDDNGKEIGYTMEYMVDKSFHEVIYNPAIKYDTLEVAIWGVHAASALAFLHSRMNIHRDVKPHNMLLCGGRKTLKLCDFGTTRLLESQKSVGVTCGVGTYPYMAPELLEGESELYCNKCDVYSLGVSLWEASTKTIPHEHLSIIDIAKHVSKGGRPSLEMISNTILKDIIERCFAGQVYLRPTMTDLKEQLDALAKSLGSYEAIASECVEDNA